MKKFLILTISLCLIGISSNSFAQLQNSETKTQLNPGNTIDPGHFDPIDIIQGSRASTLLWEQYDTDGSNGYSHVTSGVLLGVTQRDLLDDFEVPAGDVWTLTGLNTLNVWDIQAPGAVGADFVLEILADNAGSPGALITTATTASYTETATGRVWFGRPEFEMSYGFAPIVLNPGIYWIRGHIVGSDNCFWMIRSQPLIWGSELWVDYTDQGGLHSGTAQFGVAADLAFQLTGENNAPQFEVPVSNWAIIIGLLLIGTFIVIRFRRIV